MHSSNWVVSDCRNDILLGMPWHIHCGPMIDYERKTVKVGYITLPTIAERNPSITVNNIGVKKFRSLLRKKHRNSSDFMVFQARNVNNIALAPVTPSNDPVDEELTRLREEFSTVFTDELPDGLPPQRDVDHKIEVNPQSTPPHSGMFQLSPAELIATKN